MRTPRFRFTILDGLGAIVVVAVTLAAFQFFKQPFGSERDQGETALWLVTFGMAVVLTLVYRFRLARETRLIVLGMAVAFAGVSDALYFAAYLKNESTAVAVTIGLSLVSAILVGGGIADGLIVRRREGLAASDQVNSPDESILAPASEDSP